MDSHIEEFFCQASDEVPHGNFHKVIALHKSPEIEWGDIRPIIPKLCKGWYELARLSKKDRIDFLFDYWVTKLPFSPHLPESLNNFFGMLDDIGVYVVQKKFDDPYEGYLVYSIKEGGGFFRGACGADEKEIMRLKQLFPDVIFPQDYLSFLQIHNGFSKTTDTGILSTGDIQNCYQRFVSWLELEEPLITYDKEIINPKRLIPFYESFGMPVFQCFWLDWYPQDEMGNVYYSGFTNSISDCGKPEASAEETLAFPTFLDWLEFYLERIE